MATVKNFVRTHSLLMYFALVCFISWGAILMAVGPRGLPASADQLVVLVVAMLLGPSIAGILMTSLASGKAGFRRLAARWFTWRVSGRWYAVALLTAPLSTLLVLLGLSPFSPRFLPALLTSNDKITLVLMWIVGALLVGCLEELGWTGFAVPRMLPNYGVLATGIIVGLVWGAWHFLVNWEADTFSGVLPLALLLARLFSWLPAYRVLMVWVYDRTQSLLVVMLMHSSLVATTGILDPVLTGGRLLIFLLAKAIVLWIIVAVVAAARQRATVGDMHPVGPAREV